jgi:hypothetical protein
MNIQPIADANEVAAAFVVGGQKLARLVFASICEARRLKQWESIVLADYSRKLITLKEVRDGTN